MRTIRTVFLVMSAFFACASVSQAEDAAQLTDRLRRAQALNSLDDSSLQPWHLKLSFQLFDPKGQPTEQGTIEEWWRSPSSHKTVYTSPSYSATEIQSSEGVFRTKGTSSPPYLLSLVLQEIVHPLVKEDIDDSKPDFRKENFGKVALDCVMLSQPIKSVAYPPLGLFPTYCLDRNLDSLRVSFNFGTQLTLRTSIGKFQQHNVPVNLTIRLNSVDAISTHIETLRGEPLSDAQFATDDLDKEDFNTVKVSSEVMAGLITSQHPPTYPERARANHVSGSVLIRAKIGTDGRIHAMKLVNVPDPDLAIAAIAAVRQWTYKPYTLNGVPVEVETSITVNFSFGPASTFRIGR